MVAQVVVRSSEHCYYVLFTYRIAGNFRKVFIFGYFEEALLFKNKFPQVKATVQLSAIRSCIPRVLAQYC